MNSVIVDTVVRTLDSNNIYGRVLLGVYTTVLYIVYRLLLQTTIS